MTDGKNLAAWAKAQTGTPYAQMDCMKLVVCAIRNAKGADGESLTYRCGGTNELWRSLNASGKYRYITRRLELETAKALGLLRPGALLAIWQAGYNARYGDDEGDCSHIGIYAGDDDCEVIHSSATRGKVCASTLANGWTHLMVHRLIDIGDGETDEEEVDYAPVDMPYTAIVCTEKDPLVIRDKPSPAGANLGKVKRGGEMTVVGQPKQDANGHEWLPVEARPYNRRGMVRGWAASRYLKDKENDAPLDAQAAQQAAHILVPFEQVLKLADALNELRDADRYNSAAYTNAVSVLQARAQAVVNNLKGDD